MKFNQKWAKNYINSELEVNNITIKKWRKTDSGIAYISERLIEIPEPTTVNRFLICLHEITHITRSEFHKKMKVYEYEYDCEITVINKAKEIGIDTSDYEHRARGYVTYCFAKAFNRNLDLNKANKEIVNWLGIDLNQWDRYDRAYMISKNNWKNWSVKLVKFESED